MDEMNISVIKYVLVMVRMYWCWLETTECDGMSICVVHYGISQNALFDQKRINSDEQTLM